MPQDRFGIYPLTLTYAGPTTLNVQQIGRWGIKPDANKETIIPGGSVDPSAIVLNYGNPSVEFETDDLATILSVVTPSAGLACSGGALFQLQKRADGATFAGGATNVTITSKKGFCYPKTLDVRQDRAGGARLTCEYVAQYDGTTTGTPAVPTDPMAIAANQALASTPAFNARFYLGPVYVNAVEVPGITGYSVDFGIEYRTLRADGDLWPQVGSIFSRKPKFFFTLVKADYAASIGSLFNAAPAGAIAFYLRKGAPGGARVADATTGHIKITMATGAWNADSLDVQEQDDATLRVACEATGTIAVSTASAIP